MHKLQWAETFIALIISLMLYAGISKMADPALFAFQLQRSPVTLVNGNAHLLSWALPIAEICTGAAMLSSRFRKAALCTFIVMMAVFTGYIIYLLASGLKLPCSCGGLISQLSWHQHLLLNITFIAMGLLGIMWMRPRSQHITAVNRATLP